MFRRSTENGGGRKGEFLRSRQQQQEDQVPGPQRQDIEGRELGNPAHLRCGRFTRTAFCRIGRGEFRESLLSRGKILSGRPEGYERNGYVRECPRNGFYSGRDTAFS